MVLSAYLPIVTLRVNGLNASIKGYRKEQKQEELQSCSLWNKNHIHRKIDKMKRHRAM